MPPRGRPAARNRRREWVRRAALMAAGIVAGALLCELGLRASCALRWSSWRPLVALHRPRESTLFVPDDVLHHVHPRSASYTVVPPHSNEYYRVGSFNEHRLNDDPFPVDKPSGERRILVLGDSFPEALQVPRRENFCERLEDRLNRDRPLGPDVRFRVINGGVSSYSTVVEYVYLRRFGLAFDPDLVLHFFFMNDVYDDAQHALSTTFDEDRLPLATRHSSDLLWLTPAFTTPEAQRLWGIITNRYAYPRWIDVSYLATALHTAKVMATLARHRGRVPTNEALFILSAHERYRSFQERWWKNTLRMVGALAQLCGDHQVGFLSFAVPVEAQVYERPTYGTLYFNEPLLPEPAKPWSDYCREQGIGAHDLLPVLRAARDRPLYYTGDGHWRSAGHEVVADFLYDVVVPSLVRRAVGEEAP